MTSSSYGLLHRLIAAMNQQQQPPVASGGGFMSGLGQSFGSLNPSGADPSMGLSGWKNPDAGAASPLASAAPSLGAAGPADPTGWMNPDTGMRTGMPMQEMTMMQLFGSQGFDNGAVGGFGIGDQS